MCCTTIRSAAKIHKSDAEEITSNTTIEYVVKQLHIRDYEVSMCSEVSHILEKHPYLE